MICKIYPYEIKLMLKKYLDDKTGRDIDLADIQLRTSYDKKQKQVDIWVEWSDHDTVSIVKYINPKKPEPAK